MRSNRRTEVLAARAGVLCGASAIVLTITGCSGRAPGPSAAALAPLAPSVAPAPAEPVPSKVSAPPVAAAPALASTIEGAYQLASAAVVDAPPRAPAWYVYVAADGSLRVGATAVFAEARTVDDTIDLAEAVREAPSTGGQAGAPVGPAPSAGMLGTVGTAAEFASILADDGLAGDGGGLGLKGTSSGDPRQLGTLGHGAGARPVGRAARRLLVEPRSTDPSATVLVIDRQVTLDQVARVVAAIDGPVALAVEGGAAGVGVLRVSLVDAAPGLPPSPGAAIELSEDRPFAELVARLDAAAAGALPLDLSIAPLPRIAAETSVGAPEIDGELDRAIIRRLVMSVRPKVSRCYEKELRARPNLEGKVTVTFVVGGDGKVVSSTADGFDPTVASCVAGVIGTIRFPRPRGDGEVSIRYPFVFRRGP